MDEKLRALNDGWTLEQALAEYLKMVSALQYTIGERERLKALWGLVADFAASGNSATGRIMRLLQTTRAERYQDVFALLACGGKRGGYFVEYGACDGLAANNTLMLEKDFGWSGILAEPAKFWHERLRANRSAHIDTRCVSGVTGKMLEFHESRSKGTSSVHKEHQFLGEVSSSYEVETVSLLDLLAHHNAPRHIDFLSVDVEGHEKESLQSFDFDKYRFGFICVEQHASQNTANDVTPLLEAAGYKALFPRHHDKSRPPHMQVSGVDLFFVAATNPILEKAK